MRRITVVTAGKKTCALQITTRKTEKRHVVASECNNPRACLARIFRTKKELGPFSELIKEKNRMTLQGIRKYLLSR